MIQYQYFNFFFSYLPGEIFAREIHWEWLGCRRRFFLQGVASARPSTTMAVEETRTYLLSGWRHNNHFAFIQKNIQQWKMMCCFLFVYLQRTKGGSKRESELSCWKPMNRFEIIHQHTKIECTQARQWRLYELIRVFLKIISLFFSFDFIIVHPYRSCSTVMFERPCYIQHEVLSRTILRNTKLGKA